MLINSSMLVPKYCNSNNAKIKTPLDNVFRSEDTFERSNCSLVAQNKHLDENIGGNNALAAALANLASKALNVFRNIEVPSIGFGPVCAVGSLFWWPYKKKSLFYKYQYKDGLFGRQYRKRTKAGLSSWRYSKNNIFGRPKRRWFGSRKYYKRDEL